MTYDERKTGAQKDRKIKIRKDKNTKRQKDEKTKNFLFTICFHVRKLLAKTDTNPMI